MSYFIHILSLSDSPLGRSWTYWSCLLTRAQKHSLLAFALVCVRPRERPDSECRSWMKQSSLVGGTECKTPPGPENTKKNEKMTKSPISGLAPKIRKKIPKNCKKWSFSGQFGIFRSLFRIFGAKPEMGDFVIFSDFFRISRLEGFCILYHPREISQDYLKQSSSGQS